MIEPWVRLTFRYVEPDFAEMLTCAQPYSELLRRLRITRSEPVCGDDGDETSHVEILVAPTLYAYWCDLADEDIPVEHIAEGHLRLVFMRALEDAGLLPDDEEECPDPTEKPAYLPVFRFRPKPS